MIILIAMTILNTMKRVLTIATQIIKIRNRKEL